MSTSTELLFLRATHVHQGDDMEVIWWPERDTNAIYVHAESGLMVPAEDVAFDNSHNDQQLAAFDFYYVRGCAITNGQTHSALDAYLDAQGNGLESLFEYDYADLLRLLKARVSSTGEQADLILVFTWVISVYKDSEGYADCDEEWALRGVLDMDTMPKSADPWTALLRMQPAVEKETRSA